MFQKHALLVVSFCVLVGLAVAPVRSSAPPPPDAQLPAYIVKANGNPFGAFLGLTRSQEVMIGLEVAGESNLVPLELDFLGGPNVRFESCDNRVMYDQTGCTGNVYVRAPKAANGVQTSCVLLGITYAVGPNPANGNSKTIFKGTGIGSSGAGIMSQVIQDGGCTNSGTSNDIVPATPILELTTTYPPPYTME